MDYPRPRNAATQRSFAPKSSDQLIRQSLKCCHTGQPCHPGLSILKKLRFALDMLPLTEEFQIAGSSEIETCLRPCSVVWRLSMQESWLFGDVEAGADIEGLIRQSMDGAASTEAESIPEPAAMIFTSQGVLQ